MGAIHLLQQCTVQWISGLLLLSSPNSSNLPPGLCTQKKKHSYEPQSCLSRSEFPFSFVASVQSGSENRGKCKRGQTYSYVHTEYTVLMKQIHVILCVLFMIGGGCLSKISYGFVHFHYYFPSSMFWLLRREITLLCKPE